MVRFKVRQYRGSMLRIQVHTKFSSREHTYGSSFAGPTARLGLYYEPVHEISNNVVCATSKASDQPAHMRSLIRDFASCLSIL